MHLESMKADPWVDSVFNTLSIIERINQLVLLELEPGFKQASAMDFGGIFIKETNLDLYVESVRVAQDKSLIKPLIFHELGDPFGLNLDGVDHFGQTSLLGMVEEPYLFYELGVSLGKQCKTLGIAGVLHEHSPIQDVFNEKKWTLAEFNQGLTKIGILPLNAVKIHDFKEDALASLEDLYSWDLISSPPDEVDQLHQSIQELLTDDKLKIQDLEEKCRTVLTYKKWAILDQSKSNDVSEHFSLMNTPSNLLLHEELAKFQLVVTGQGKNHVPIKQLEDKKIAHLSLGNGEKAVFNEYANRYTEVDYFKSGYLSSDEEYAGLWTQLNSYDMIICTYYNVDQISELSEEQDGFLIFQDWIAKSGKSMSVVFVNEKGFVSGDVIVFENNDLTNKLAAEVVFGGSEAYGKTGVFGWQTTKGIGLDISGLNRFSYTLPEAVGLNSGKLNKIDSIASEAIRSKAMPGCQILVAKDNHVVYQKSFGYHTYDNLKKVTNTDLYDLASVTKVAGALPCLMKLYEEGKFDLDATMGTYLPYFKRGNKKTLTYREILAHQSGLFPYIVYWKTAIKKNGKFRRKTLSHEKNEDFSYELSPGLYLHNEYKKKIYKQIRKSKIGEKKYSYSGLSFLLYPEIIESITGQNYEDYLYENFYKPLGASTLTYNPLSKYEVEKITPTEYDSIFRKVQVHGKVHDEAAAVMEGVSSNAGLFANANDLAKLFQMYCNYGTYGNKEYLNEETIMEFTRCQYPDNDNRRGLGFDRPLPEPHENGNTAKSVSQLSFGHSGFTGTFAWADPESNLVYIFLSNRVYQTRENRKLYELNVRTNIQEVIYEAIKNVD